MRAPGSRARRVTVGVVALLLAVCACGQAGGPATAEPRPAAQSSSEPVLRPGLGEFSFTGYGPLSDRPVRVYYAAPANPATAQILIVMHGVGRNAKDYRADWEPLVKSRNVLVLAPDFSEQEYPGHSAYSLGNMTDDDDNPLPRAQWSFNIVESLFDFVVRDVGSSAHDYALFGHSAGAQFVHRFVEFMPNNRARVAAAANPGWYTMPDDAVPFPYGLHGAPVSTRELGPAFASNFVLLLGGSDTDPDDESLRHDHLSDQQGSYRLERGQNFFRLATQVARSGSLPFHWRLQVVPGVAHDHTEMADAAAPLLLTGGS